MVPIQPSLHAFSYGRRCASSVRLVPVPPAVPVIYDVAEVANDAHRHLLRPPDSCARVLNDVSEVGPTRVQLSPIGARIAMRARNRGGSAGNENRVFYALALSQVSDLSALIYISAGELSIATLSPPPARPYHVWNIY